MMFGSRIPLVCMSLVLGIGLTACGSSKKKSLIPVTPVSGDANTGDGADKVTPIVLGQDATAKGDVLKDENDMYSLTRVYSFKLEEEMSLQIRKSFSNGNCGRSNASFIVMKGEDQIADVTIDRDKQYDGIPVEKFEAPLSAGEYSLIAFITLDQECKNMLFYYDFFLEETK